MNGWWALTIPRYVKVKSRHVRNLRPQNLPLISLLQACGMSEYVSSIIILESGGPYPGTTVYRHENNARQSEYYYTYDKSVYLDNNKYFIPISRNPVKYWVVQITLNRKTHVCFFLIG
jgi:hypothetical protein